MDFEKELIEFIYSLTSVKKPIKENNKFPSKCIITEDGKMEQVKDVFIYPGEVSEDNQSSIKPIYWDNDIKNNSSMNEEKEE